MGDSPNDRRAGLDRREDRRITADLEELAALEKDRTKGSRSSRAASSSTERLRASTELRIAQRDFESLHGVISAVMTESDLGRVVHAILEQAIRALGADRGILFLGRAPESGLMPVQAANLRGETLRTVERVSRTILAKMHAGELVLLNDALNDPQFREVASVQVNRVCSVLCAPLVGSSGLVGGLYLDAASPNAFRQESLQLVRALAEISAIALERAQNHAEMTRDVAAYRWTQPADGLRGRVAGSSDVMEALRRRATVAALLDAPVLIVGEPGTGKHLLARSIHDVGSRTSHPFVMMDCATPPSRASVLGRVGIAAARKHMSSDGILRGVHRGTLYVSVAQALPEVVGSELLESLDRGWYRPMGGRRDERINFRLIVSTRPESFAGENITGFLRALDTSDLTIRLDVPPLRSRVEDVPDLAHSILASMGRKVHLTPAALEALSEHSWPGNVRELQQVLSRVLLLSGKPLVDADQIREAIEAKAEAKPHFGPWSGETKTLAEWEHEAIRQALIHAKGNKTKAAQMLGIHRNTLGLKLALHADLRNLR